MKFLGVTILQGGRIFHFPIDFRMGLTTVQRDCAACDYTESRSINMEVRVSLNIVRANLVKQYYTKNDDSLPGVANSSAE